MYWTHVNGGPSVCAFPDPEWSLRDSGHASLRACRVCGIPSTLEETSWYRTRPGRYGGRRRRNLGQSTWAQHLGLSALTLAIVCGIVAGNTVFPVVATHVSTGVDFSKNMLLRAGIVLYGFRITFQQIADVGWAGVTTAVMMVTSTFLLSFWWERAS